MTSISAPTITHPAGCDPTHCGEDRSSSGTLWATYHWSAEDSWASADGRVTASVQLGRTDSHEDNAPRDATVVFFRTSGGDSPSPVGELDALAAWLTATAADVRQAIATEDGAR